MSANRYEYDTIRAYLLGQLTGAEHLEFEQRYFADDELFKDLQAAEDDLIDDYLTGDLSEADVEKFNENFMVGPERKQRLRIVKAYRKFAASHAGKRSKNAASQCQSAAGSNCSRALL